MKFWRQILLTTLTFLSIASITLYTSCEKDQCSRLQCQNGGICVSGVCQCTTGYEGTQCETRSIDRYLGTYYGTTTDKIFHLIDTVVISQGNDLTSVNVTMRAYSPDAFTGTILQDQSGYHILVPAVNIGSYNKTTKIDLYDNIDPKGTRKLIIYKTVTTDTVAPYQFIGTNP